MDKVYENLWELLSVIGVGLGEGDGLLFYPPLFGLDLLLLIFMYFLFFLLIIINYLGKLTLIIQLIYMKIINHPYFFRKDDH